MNPVKLTLPDGTSLTFEGPTTPAEVIKRIGCQALSDALAAKVDSKLVDLDTRIERDASIMLVLPSSKEGLEILRHSTAHVLAQAVKELYPGTQIAIGPTIEDGFYYDIECPKQLTSEDLPTIESKMAEIIGRKQQVTHRMLAKAEAVTFFENEKEKYKIEIIRDLPEDQVSIYSQGNFTDLCRGPHVPNTGRLKKFKLLSVAGAYWRGNEKNAMLQRIYGTAWATEKDLKAYLTMLEEAKKRDHRKLGPELGLFTFLPVAPAMPFYQEKGTRLFNIMTDFMRGEVASMGYKEVICPQLMLGTLWQKSGHLDYYRENMFVVEEKDEPLYVLKPMNCPGHLALYSSERHSYRELPIRFAEFTRLHRRERAGVTHGLLRTRAFCQDDGHIFCMPEHVSAEASALIKHVFKIYKLFGFSEVSTKLATRPEKFAGTIEAWDQATETLAQTLRNEGLAFEIAEGEAVFYGPKIEFHIRDSLGRYWQCGTIQLDFNLPERFQIEYIDSQSKPQRPVMIHRAVLGSLERFIGILIEHHAGHLPVWISPTQVAILNVTSEQETYMQEVASLLRSWGVRVEVDTRNEKLNYKIREAQLQKTPMMLILGPKEVEQRTVSVRTRTGETHNGLALDKFREWLEPQLKPKEE